MNLSAKSAGQATTVGVSALYQAVEDEDPSSDPPDALSERDRELYAAVLFLLERHLQKLARERSGLKPPPAGPDAEENSN